MFVVKLCCKKRLKKKMEFVSLLEGNTIEERIGGIIFCYKYMKSNSSSLLEDRENLFQLLQRVLLIIKPLFLIRMLHTNYTIKEEEEDKEGEKKEVERTIQEITIYLLDHISNYPQLLIQFSSYFNEICDIALLQVRKERKKTFNFYSLIDRSFSIISSSNQSSNRI